MDQLSRLRRSRAGLKARLKVLARDFTSACDTAQETLVVEEFLTRLEALAGKARKVQDELEGLLPEEQLEQEVETYMVLESDVSRLRVEAKLCLEKKKMQTSSVKEMDNGGSSAPVLPRWDLPKFDGDVLSFTAFWDQFDAGVHSRSDVSDVTKLVYLKTCLAGVALDAIAGYSVTAASYGAALATLKSRFGRPQRVAEKHILDLIQIERCSRPTATELRHLHDTVARNVRALTALDKDPSGETLTAADVLLAVLKQKIPSVLRKPWESKVLVENQEKVTLQALLEFLQIQVEIEEAAVTCVKESSDRKGKAEPIELQQRQRKERHSSAAALQATVQKGSRCIFCAAEHESARCQRFGSANVKERWKMVREKRACFSCLEAGHQMRNCVRGQEGSQYHPMLVVEHRGKMFKNSRVQVGVGMPTNGRVLLQTARAVLRTMNGDRTVVTCLLDGGSQRSFITEEVANRMGLRGPREYVEISTLGGGSKCCRRTRRVRFTLSALGEEQTGKNESRTMEALCLPKICSPLHSNPVLRKEWNHLRGLKLADQFPRECLKIDVLIGLDYYYDFVSQEIRRGAVGEPVALRTLFGWIICGNAGHKDTVGNVQSLHVQVAEDLNEILRRFWELEALGIRDVDIARELEATELMKYFAKTVTFDGERYVVPLPWKSENVDLPNNYEQAKWRLLQMERKLNDPRQRSMYVEAMDAYFANGWVEEVNEDSERLGKTWYLPHHAVFREEKTTTKCRVVFDGSVRYEGQSLNDQLEPGPALQRDLVGVLLRFRRYRFGLQADISKMFMQVGLYEGDRDVTRYLWRNMNTKVPPRTFRFKRLTFGLRCSPFLAMMAVQHHVSSYKHQYKREAEEVLSNMYVDDFVTSCGDSEEAIVLVTQLRKLMQLGGFNLTKWKCNSPSVLMSAVPGTDCTVDADEVMSKTLGVPWNLHKNALTYVMPNKALSKIRDTKRELLSLVVKIFDPLGFLGPFTVRAKIILQLLWQSDVGWDEDIPFALSAKWQKWKQELSMLPDLVVQRTLVPVELKMVSSIELHAFADASEVAYGAVVYLRVEIIDAKSFVNVVVAKTRVAPLKKLTLPRLELTAALIAARLVCYVKRELEMPITQVRCWSDSKVALSWIHSPSKNWKSFVQNRVQEIQTLVEPNNWRYCAGKDNPADLLSRGTSIESLKSNSCWWHGPIWLKAPEACWPIDDMGSGPSDVQRNIIQQEERKKVISFLAKEDKDEQCSLPLRYSSFERLIRITAWLFRFVKNCRLAKEMRNYGPISVEELVQAEKHWFRRVQGEAFADEISCITKKRALNKSSKLLMFDPYLDSEGLLRVGGRLQCARIPESAKHQILLPPNHVIVDLLVMRCHERQLHAGVEHTLSILRQSVWILRGRSRVKRNIRDCVVCKAQRTVPFEQKMSSLPADRLKATFAFENTGLDFVGPLYVRRRRTCEKAYICLFTCMTTRAVHLELVSDMTAPRFVQALRRFFA